MPLARGEVARLGESISGLANDLRRRAERLGRTDLASRITSEAEWWAESSTTVAVIGARGSGASSLVAAVTERRDLGLAGPTLTPVIIRRATVDRMTVCDLEGNLRETHRLLDPFDPALTQYVEMAVDAARLHRGLTLVDTPSAGSSADPRGNRTYVATRRADHLVVTVDLAAPISGPEVAVVERCADRFASVTLIGTRIDRIRGWRQVLDDSSSALRAALPDHEIVEFGVSATLAEAAFAHDLDDAEAVELLTDSGLSSVQSHLGNLLDRRRQVRLANFSALLEAIAAELAGEGRVVIQAALDDTDHDVSRLAGLRHELTRVRDDRSTWLAILSDAVSTARDETAQDLARTLAVLVAEYDSQADDWKGDADDLLELFDDDLQTEAAAFAARIADRIEHVIELIATSSDADELGVYVDTEQLAVDLAAVDSRDSVVAARAGESGQFTMRATGGVVGVATSTTMMMTALAAPGGAAALMRVGAFGAAALFSGVSTAIAVASGKRQRDRQHLRAVLKARVDGIRSESQGVLRRYFSSVQRSIESSLKDTVRDRVAVLEREISEIQTTARADATERRRLASSLEDELRHVGELQEQSRRLAARITGGGQ